MEIKSRRARRCGALAVLLLSMGVVCSLVMTGLARADADPPDYRALVKDALAEFEAQNYPEARALFLRAHALSPNARTLRGLGAVCFELRRYTESVGFLDAALASHEKPLEGELRAATEQLRARARTYVGELLLSLVPRETQVSLDGKTIDLSEPTVWLDIGNHQLDFRAPGHVDEQRALEIVGGERASWEIVLRGSEARAPVQRLSDPSPPHAEKVDSSDPSPRRRLLAGSIFGAAGAASVAVAAARYAAHREDGRAVRMRENEDVRTQRAWNDSRPLPLVLAGAGTGLLAASAAAFGDLVPHRHRRWVSPLFLSAGAAVLAGGLIGIARGDSCGDRAGGELRRCVRESEHRDRGIIVAFSALPLLTIPTEHAVDWLRGR